MKLAEFFSQGSSKAVITIVFGVAVLYVPDILQIFAVEAFKWKAVVCSVCGCVLIGYDLGTLFFTRS